VLTNSSWAWWYRSVTPTLSREIKFQASLGSMYSEILSPKKKNKKPNESTVKSYQVFFWPQ
jgi:hypothetical protein